MDLELLIDVLEKHGIDNPKLAEDLWHVCQENYKDGMFDVYEWWQEQDNDKEWIEHWESIFGDIPYNKDLHSTDRDLPPGHPLDRRKEDGKE